MKRIYRCIPVFAAAAAAVPAQLLVDGNLRVQTAGPSATSQLPSGFDLQADALSTDHAFEHWWYYRVAGDTREYSLRDVGPVSSGVSPTNDHGDLDFGDVDGRGLLKLAWDLDIYDCGPASGVFISRVTVMNVSAVPQTIDMFCYTDVDVVGTFADDLCLGDNSSHRVTDGSGVQIEIRAIGNDFSDALAFGPIRARLSDASIDNLTNALPPLVGDYTGAFQWANRTLQPFQQRTFQVVIAVDTPAVVPPFVEHYGWGNGGAFEIHTETLPLQDNSQVRQFRVQVKNALPNAIYRLGSCLGPFNAQPFIGGIDLWIDPYLFIGLWGGLTSSTGEAQEVFSIPPGPYYAGLTVFHQGLYADATAPNGFAFFTPGMATRIGKL